MAKELDAHVEAFHTRCADNLMPATPGSSWGWVKALLHSIYDQPDAARADVLAVTAFPREISRIWFNKSYCCPIPWQA